MSATAFGMFYDGVHSVSLNRNEARARSLGKKLLRKSERLASAKMVGEGIQDIGFASNEDELAFLIAQQDLDTEGRLAPDAKRSSGHDQVPDTFLAAGGEPISDLAILMSLAPGQRIEDFQASDWLAMDLLAANECKTTGRGYGPDADE